MEVSHVAAWDPVGESWTPLGAGTNGLVNALVAGIGTGNIYAGGSFTLAGGSPASRVAKWDTATESWSPLGDGVDDTVETLVIVGINVYLCAGGWFNNAGGSPASRVAKWDMATESWSRLGLGTFDGAVKTLVTDGDGGINIFAGGLFTTIGGVPFNHMAKMAKMHMVRRVGCHGNRREQRIGRRGECSFF